MSFLRLEHFDEKKNDEDLRFNKETMDEVHDIALARIIEPLHVPFLSGQEFEPAARRLPQYLKKKHYQFYSLEPQSPSTWQLHSAFCQPNQKKSTPALFWDFVMGAPIEYKTHVPTLHAKS